MATAKARPRPLNLRGHRGSHRPCGRIGWYRGRPARDRRGERLWRRIKAAEPFLATLETAARQFAGPDEEDWRLLKGTAAGCVGWRRMAEPAWLRAEWVYDLTMRRLRHALEAPRPPCEGRPRVSPAPSPPPGAAPSRPR